jgi:hypothetical protein
VELISNVEHALVDTGHLLVRGSQAGRRDVYLHATLGHLADFFGPWLDHHAGDWMLGCQKAVQQQAVALGHGPKWQCQQQGRGAKCAAEIHVCLLFCRDERA